MYKNDKAETNQSVKPKYPRNPDSSGDESTTREWDKSQDNQTDMNQSVKPKSRNPESSEDESTTREWDKSQNNQTGNVSRGNAGERETSSTQTPDRNSQQQGTSGGVRNENTSKFDQRK